MYNARAWRGRGGRRGGRSRGSNNQREQWRPYSRFVGHRPRANQHQPIQNRGGSFVGRITENRESVDQPPSLIQPFDPSPEITTPTSAVVNKPTNFHTEEEREVRGRAEERDRAEERGGEAKVDESLAGPPEKKQKLQPQEETSGDGLYTEDDIDNGSFSNNRVEENTDDSSHTDNIMELRRRALLEPVTDNDMMLINQRMIYSHHHNRQLFFCALCTAKLTTTELLVKHLKNMEHDRRAKMYINWSKDKASHPFFCEVCVAACTYESMLEDHLMGKKHAKTLTQVNSLKRGEYGPISPVLLLQLLCDPPVLKTGNGISLGLSPTMMRFFNLPGPFIGLQYAEEIGAESDPTPRYYCHICKTHMDCYNVGLHFTSTAHRHNVLDYPDLLKATPRTNAKKDTERCAMLAAKVEAQEGRKIELIKRKILKEDVMSVSATQSNSSDWWKRPNTSLRGPYQGRGRGRGWSSDSLFKGSDNDLRGHGGYGGPCRGRGRGEFGGYSGPRGGRGRGEFGGYGGPRGGRGQGERGGFGQGRGPIERYSQGNQSGNMQRGRGQIGRGISRGFSDQRGWGRSRGIRSKQRGQGGRGKWLLSQAYGGSGNYGNQGSNPGQSTDSWNEPHGNYDNNFHGDNIDFDDVGDSYYSDNVEWNDASTNSSSKRNEVWDNPNVKEEQNPCLSWNNGVQAGQRMRGRVRERGLGRMNVYTNQEIQQRGGINRVRVYSQEHIENHFSVQPLVTTPTQMATPTQVHRLQPGQSPLQFSSIGGSQVHPVTVLSSSPTVLPQIEIHKEQPPMKLSSSKADIFQNLAMSSIDSEEDAEMALQLSSTLTQALLAYRIKNVTNTNPLTEVLSVVQKASLPPGPTQPNMQ